MKRKTYNRFHLIFDGLLKLRIPILSRLIIQSIYDDEFYDDANQMKVKTAEQVAKVINSFFKYDTLFDIGCGMGLYINELRKTGKTVLGCDYSDAAVQIAPEEVEVFKADATKPIHIDKTFDLVMCFEVAEHIQTQLSQQLVTNCTSYADTVIFTAAPVGQGGVGHINEQPYDFWINLFENEDFQYNRSLSESVRSKMQDEDIVPWLANNFMCFKRRNH